ncbi:hypothetical protein CEXT_652071 [Caerostris extrusa]|uniref:Uncharacterized protein n=1 Tax=Caerostris extrusa TaxID=172846 RepID=A0AAV4RJU2_CAEEX|nr:hypothetical protein CEXT_652071 [Caerostris extrusa]
MSPRHFLHNPFIMTYNSLVHFFPDRVTIAAFLLKEMMETLGIQRGKFLSKTLFSSSSFFFGDMREHLLLSSFIPSFRVYVSQHIPES